MARDDESPEEAEGEADGGGGTGSFVAGVMVGALIGAGLALLFAPESGVHTRRRLGRGLRDFRERAGDTLDAASRGTRKELNRRRRRLEAQLERLTAEARGRIEDLR